MVKIVDQIVEHYQNDFYEYDIDTLDHAETDNHRQFIWIPRTNGTFLIPVDNAVGMENWFDAIMQNFRGELSLYQIKRNGERWSLLPFSENKARDVFKRQKHFDMQVLNEYGNEMWSDTGIFDNQKLADDKVFDIMQDRGGKYCSAIMS